MAPLANVDARGSLTPRRDPYWLRITKGCYLGFRRMTAHSEGNWLARHLNDSTGKQEYRRLGDFADLPGRARFDAAKRAAEEWFVHLGKGGSSSVVTVQDACDKYVKHLSETRGDKAAADAKSRFAAYVTDNQRFASTDLTKLTPAHIEVWRRSIRERKTKSGANRGNQRSDSSLNRDMTCLRAALNLAYRDGWTTSDFAWRSKLRPIKNADRRRDVYLPLAERKRLIKHATAELGCFLRGLSLIPLRPGALAALIVRNFDKRLGTLAIGTDKAGADRKIALPVRTAQFFAGQVKNKTPAAPIFSRADGKAWNKDAWKYPVKDAVVAAKLPLEITAYAIRHSVITDLIHSGLDTLTVAQLSGTSVLMIERNYGHLTKAHAKEALSRLTI